MVAVMPGLAAATAHAYLGPGASLALTHDPSCSPARTRWPLGHQRRGPGRIRLVNQINGVALVDDDYRHGRQRDRHPDPRDHDHELAAQRPNESARPCLARAGPA